MGKQYFIILIQLLLTSTIYGQDTIKIEDIFKNDHSSDSSRKQKKELGIEAKSYLTDEFAKVIDDYVYIVETKYCLKKGKNFFGKNGEESFGSKMGLGIMFKNKIWTSKQLTKPWDDDSDYIEIKDEYKAEVSQVNITKIGDNTQQKFLQESVSFEDTATYFTQINLKKYNARSIPASNKFSASGMLVLYYKNGEDSIFSFNKKVVFCTPQWNEDSGFIEELSDKNLAGGFFLHLNFANARVGFTLGGIISDVEHNSVNQKRIIPLHKPTQKTSKNGTDDDSKVDSNKSKKDKINVTEIKKKN